MNSIETVSRVNIISGLERTVMSTVFGAKRSTRFIWSVYDPLLTPVTVHLPHLVKDENSRETEQHRSLVIHTLHSVRCKSAPFDLCSLNVSEGFSGIFCGISSECVRYTCHLRLLNSSHFSVADLKRHVHEQLKKAAFTLGALFSIIGNNCPGEKRLARQS